MSDRIHFTAGIPSGALMAVCCGFPLLLVMLGAAGVTVSLAQAGYILVPFFLLVLAGYYGFRFFRRRSAVRACCDPVALKHDPEVKS